jgi:hypothetical protein
MWGQGYGLRKILKEKYMKLKKKKKKKKKKKIKQGR